MHCMQVELLAKILAKTFALWQILFWRKCNGFAQKNKQNCPWFWLRKRLKDCHKKACAWQRGFWWAVENPANSFVTTKGFVAKCVCGAGSKICKDTQLSQIGKRSVGQILQTKTTTCDFGNAVVGIDFESLCFCGKDSLSLAFCKFALTKQPSFAFKVLPGISLNCFGNTAKING